MILGSYYLLMNALKGSIKDKVVFDLSGKKSKLNTTHSGYPSVVQIPLSVIPREFTG